jgi:hypothetical protein
VTFLWAALAMAAKDAFGTLLVIAEARGRTWLAGALDAAGDIAQVAAMVFGAGTVIVHGWDAHSIEILATMMAVSFFGTAFWTQLGRRIMPATLTVVVP